MGDDLPTPEPSSKDIWIKLNENPGSAPLEDRRVGMAEVLRSNSWSELDLIPNPEAIDPMFLPLLAGLDDQVKILIVLAIPDVSDERHYRRTPISYLRASA